MRCRCSTTTEAARRCKPGEREPARATSALDRGGHRTRRSDPASRSTAAGSRRQPKPAMPTGRPGTSGRSRCCATLIERFGRAEVEHVLSGPGLVNLHASHTSARCAPRSTTRRIRMRRRRSRSAALERRCGGCVDALDIFVGAYGAEAGNLALRTVCHRRACSSAAASRRRSCRRSPTAGSCAPSSTRRPFRDMLARMPVKIILNPDAGLLGAAIAAA